jgi:phage gp29-like protein
MEVRNKTIEAKIEIGLGSRGRLRIIRELANRPEFLFTKYALEKRTGLRSVDVKADLKSLLDFGWVKENRQRLVKYKINLDDELVKKTIDYFKSIGYTY